MARARRPKRVMSEEAKTKQKLGMDAQHAAKRYVLENHKKEYEEAHVRERLKLGLPPHSAPASRDEKKIKEMLKKLDARRDKLQKELEEISPS